MEISKKPWPAVSVCGIKSRIDTNPDFQRPAVWVNSQKQLLIDSILRGYDIPKFYWRKTGSGPDKYDVVDGQQRLRAIFEFHEGKFALPKDSDPIDGIDPSKLKYADLPDVPDIQQKDDQRLFSREQRLAIFRRDGGICLVKVKCNGVKCEWDAW